MTALLLLAVLCDPCASPRTASLGLHFEHPAADVARFRVYWRHADGTMADWNGVDLWPHRRRRKLGEPTWPGLDRQASMLRLLELDPAKLYQLGVTAVNRHGESAMSEIIEVCWPYVQHGLPPGSGDPCEN